MNSPLGVNSREKIVAYSSVYHGVCGWVCVCVCVCVCVQCMNTVFSVHSFSSACVFDACVCVTVCALVFSVFMRACVACRYVCFFCVRACMRAHMWAYCVWRFSVQLCWCIFVSACTFVYIWRHQKPRTVASGWNLMIRLGQAYVFVLPPCVHKIFEDWMGGVSMSGRVCVLECVLVKWFLRIDLCCLFVCVSV